MQFLQLFLLMPKEYSGNIHKKMFTIWRECDKITINTIENWRGFMEQTVKVCTTTNLEESLKGVASSNLVVWMAPSVIFAQCAKKIQEVIPEIPNIGVCGQGYYELHDYPESMIVIGFKGCQAVVDVISDVKKPISSVQKLMDNVQKIQGNGNNTVCLDFTTGNDSVMVTTFNACLNEKGISLVGATAWDNKVSCNGVVYENACVYALIKNLKGTIRTYKENIYSVDESMPKFIATKIEEETQKIITMDNQSAAQVYQKALGIDEHAIETQTFKNPIGRLVGDEVYIISIKSKCPDGSMECYKRANHMDALTILQLDDYKAIIQDTVSTIKREIPALKGVFSINCILRYLMFLDLKYMDEYLKTMNQLGTHVGLVGCGEHFRTQHVNQTMTCFAFD